MDQKDEAIPRGIVLVHVFRSDFTYGGEVIVSLSGFYPSIL